MDKYIRLEEFTKDEILNQLKQGDIDIDFLLEYTIKRDNVYNQLIDRINELENRHNKSIKYITDRMIVEQSFMLDRNQCSELIEILKGKNE